MDYLTITAAVLTVAGASGGIAAWYKRGEGKDTLELAQTTIAMYKDREAAYLQQIATITARVTALEKTLEEQRITIRTMVKEFKDYKNGTNS